MELRASCCRLSWGTKPESSTWTWTKMQSTEWCHMTSPKKKFKHVPYAEKNVSLSGWGVILVSLLPRESTVISNCYVETLGSLNDCFCQVHPKRKMSEVLLLHDNARLHTELYKTEATTDFEWTVCCIHSTVAPSEYQLLDLLGGGSCDTITPLTSHCKTSYVSGSRGGWKTSTG